MTNIINLDNKYLIFREVVYERLATAMLGYPYVPSYTEDVVGDWSSEILDCWKRGMTVEATANKVRVLIKKETV